LEASKACSTCGIEKPLSEYDRDKGALDGRRSRCKSCRVLETQRDRAQHYETRIKPYQKEWASANEEHLREYKVQYYLDNRYRWLAQRHNIEFKRAARLRARRWREANPEKVHRAYHRNLKSGKYREYGQRRRARLIAAPINDFTAEQWAEMQEYFGFRCAYCGQEADLTMDHVVPISKEGPHTQSNIVPACQSCNSSKKDNRLLDVVDRLSGDARYLPTDTS